MTGIGLFDSGVGGLTVLNRLARDFPRINFYFIGDNKRAPYGSRTSKEIQQYSKELIHILSKKEVDMVVAACNTASSIGFERLQADFHFPIYGIIDPTAHYAIQKSKTGKIAVIATEKTIEQAAYQKKLKEMDPNIQVHALATPELVPLVEANLMGTQEAEQVVKEALSPLNHRDFDTLILGCTHYPYLSHEIEKSLNRSVFLLDASMAASTIIEAEDRHNQAGQDREICLYTTGEIEAFEMIAQGLLQDLDYSIEKIFRGEIHGKNFDCNG